MTQEDKQLLLKDLNARLPYGVYVEHTTTKIIGKLKSMFFEHIYNNTDSIQDINAWTMFFGDEYVDATYFRPFLRPMSSMTDEECKELEHIFCEMDVPCLVDTYYGCLNFAGGNDFIDAEMAEVYTDWLNKKMFDYRGLIEKGIALEAPDDIYK